MTAEGFRVPVEAKQSAQNAGPCKRCLPSELSID